MSTMIPEPATIEYPDNDGLPMAENTLQFEYITTIQGGLDALFRSDPNVFVAGDNLWYPVEGHPEIRTAPDVYVVFGRPKGHRGSYRQWEEDGIPLQIVFEILSPGNTVPEMNRKFAFYYRYGVEEYYIYDPDRGDVQGFLREGDDLREVPNMQGYISPRLQVRFELVNGDLQLYGPDGRRFATYVELVAQQQVIELARQQAELGREQAERRAEEEKQRAERLASQLRALGVDPTD